MQEKKKAVSPEAIKNFLFTLLTCVLIAAVALIIVYTSPQTGGAPLNPEEPSTETGNTKIEFVMPVSGGELIKDYSDTALKFNSTLKQWEAHKAVDIKTEEGTDVVAVFNGVILKIETTYLLGTMITIDHGSGLKTVYASLSSELIVEEGQTVKTGEKIATVTNSAKGEEKDGVHLHFEVLKDGKKVNPNLYLTFGEK